jgi:hypothetical protein
MIHKKPLLSFFSKQNKNKGEASSLGTTTTPLPVPSDHETETAVSSSILVTPDSEKVSKWPSIWSQDMWERKKEAFPWLDCKNGLLGCTLCSQVSHLGAFKKERVSVSKEWCAYTVNFNGSNKSAQLTSLRKKIFLHKQSAVHLTAETISAKAEKETIESICDKMNMANLESTIKIFRSAYYLAKIEKLCARFRLNSSKIKNGFRDYLENSTVIPKDLNPLINCSKLIPCSSSECERGFSHMNIIVSPTRTRLTIKHVSALMFIKLNGPNIRTWKPEYYVRTWLGRHRSADDTRTRRANHQPVKEDVEEDAFAEYL